MSVRHWFVALALGAGLGAAGLLAHDAHATGSLADVSVIDRSTGQVLPVYAHQGRYWVQGRPGSRYAVRVHNKSGERLLSVIAVDGVNVISGETAGTGQAGYVFSPWERYDVSGWRKSNAQVAAFFFTALENSYAARTGRPNDVGVIGVALFREKPAVQPSVVPRPMPYRRGDGGGAAADMRERAELPAAPMPEPNAAAKSGSAAGALGENRAAAAPPAPAQPRLGTGHGEREYSRVETTTFQRASEAPDEVITIHYDSRENLVAMGVIPAPQPMPRPRPFPGQPEIGYVPDPPGRW